MSVFFIISSSSISSSSSTGNGFINNLNWIRWNSNIWCNDNCLILEAAISIIVYNKSFITGEALSVWLENFSLFFASIINTLMVCNIRVCIFWACEAVSILEEDISCNIALFLNTDLIFFVRMIVVITFGTGSINIENLVFNTSVMNT